MMCGLVRVRWARSPGYAASLQPLSPWGRRSSEPGISFLMLFDAIGRRWTQHLRPPWSQVWAGTEDKDANHSLEKLSLVLLSKKAFAERISRAQRVNIYGKIKRKREMHIKNKHPFTPWKRLVKVSLVKCQRWQEAAGTITCHWTVTWCNHQLASAVSRCIETLACVQVKHVYSILFIIRKLVIPPNTHQGMDKEIGIYSKLKAI